MNTKRQTMVFCLLLVSLLASSCGSEQISEPIITTTPNPTLTFTLTSPPTPKPSSTATLRPTKTPIPTSTTNPSASSFGNLILNAIQGQKPFFEDDFSSDKGWVAESGGVNSELAPISLDGEFIQTLEDGKRHSTLIHVKKLIYLQNFVMKVDAAFMEGPSSHRDRSIGLCWWPGDNIGESFWLRESGIYEGTACTPTGGCSSYVTGSVKPISTEEIVSLILIHRKGESVVYVNGVPVMYHFRSIANPNRDIAFCPLTNDGLQSDIKYDNVQVWDLDQIP